MIAQELLSALARIEFTSHLVASLLYVLAGMLLTVKNGKHSFYRPLQIACYITALTQVIVAGFKVHWLAESTVYIFKAGNLGVWAVVLWRLLEASTGKRVKAYLKAALGIVWTISALLIVDREYDLGFSITLFDSRLQTIIGPILMTLMIMALIEQLFRNSTISHRHNLKYMGIGLVVLMSCQLYDLTYQSLFDEHDPNVIDAEGVINFLVAGLFLFGSLRTQPEQAISISRKMAFYSSSLLIAGLFLVCMSLAAYYAQLQGAPWSAALQLVLFIFTFISLCVAAASRSVRANIQVFVNKHFFRHKYDYRHVWLNLIKTLSETSEHDDFYTSSLKAVADIFKSNGGSLWLKDDIGQFEQVSVWNINMPVAPMVSVDSDFVKPFIEKEWVYALGDSGSSLIDPYNDYVPSWIHEIDEAWVIAPLMIGSELTGFFLLAQPSNPSPLIWEDLDVLKSVGRQLASYIVRQKSAEQLAEAKQFDTYNKLTAFIMHDLKNLIAQQALVVQNANKHKENPAFVEDAIKTIDNSVARMSHLLKRLQSSGQSAPQRSVSLQKILLDAIRKSTDRQPIPTLRNQSADASVVADQEQLVMILMHVIRNAQDATDSDGFIDVTFTTDQDYVLIEIEDNGCGMDEDFLRNRLFKPFESTKSSMGMGIGAYQVREFIQNMGGHIKVSSELDAGTNVCIKLPVSNNETET
jgi:putative PEP-CTERM system histidine kinase